MELEINWTAPPPTSPPAWPLALPLPCLPVLSPAWNTHCPWPLLSRYLELCLNRVGVVSSLCQMCPGIPRSDPRVCASVSLDNVFPFASERNMVSENDSLGGWGRDKPFTNVWRGREQLLVKWQPQEAGRSFTLLYLHPFFAPQSLSPSSLCQCLQNGDTQWQLRWAGW